MQLFPFKVSAYNCSKTCGAGYEFQSERKCCQRCVACVIGEFSPGKGKMMII